MTLYNEIDPFAAEWLGNLIAAGELPQGHVNNRSIKDLSGADCGETTHLFAGIGGWPLALRLAGWPDERPVWTGSCPCQPYSAAGKGKGDADERSLWPEMYRLIRECRPATIFGEQVAAAIGHGWIDGVRADLEREGYAFGFHVLPACGVGSPNIRQRAFWVANAERSGVRMPGHGTNGGEASGVQGQNGKRKRVRFDFGTGSDITDPELIRIVRECGFWPGCERTREGNHATSCPGRKWGHDPKFWEQFSSRMADTYVPQFRRFARTGEQSEHEQDSRSVRLGNADGARANAHAETSSPRGAIGESGSAGGMAGAASLRLGTDSLAGLVVAGRHGSANASPWDDFRVIPCKDNKSRRVGRGVQPLAHGIPVQLRPLFAWLGRLGIDASPLTRMARLARRNRTGRLKGYGNAINPIIAAEFVRAFLAI